MSASRLLEGSLKGAVDDPTFIEACEYVRKLAYKNWLTSDPDAPEARERIYRNVHAVDQIQSVLTAWAESGKVEAEKLRMDEDSLRRKEDARTGTDG